jgi:5-methylcytosine-specific restriction endonuclease McrA
MVERLKPRRVELPRIQPLKPGKRIRDSRRWKAASRYHRWQHPICEACGLNLSDEVHHRIPVARAPELAFEPSNLMALCHACHCAAHGKQARGMVSLPPAIPPKVVLPVDHPRAISRDSGGLAPPRDHDRERAAQLIA